MKEQGDMNRFFETIRELKQFLILWLTQSLSAFGSAMTNFALIIWLYNSTGSALSTALLSVCSYAPYVAMSIFAGAISDRWNKRAVMLVCDTFAAACTVVVLILLHTDNLQAWHLYLLNALNGLMNTVQQPASDVATTLLTPPKHFQRVSGLRYLSNSLVTILTPVCATALVAFAGVEAVIAVDLFTFAAAFISLLLFIRIPAVEKAKEVRESLFQASASGLRWLRRNPGILWLMLFLAGINLIASMFNSALPALVLSKIPDGEGVLGAVNTCAGLATLAGSLLATVLPKPKSRVRVICNALLLSMSTENFFLALSDTPWVWCMGAILGWIAIPLMSANLDTVNRMHIPVEMQGRVFSVRNTLQFFTIPVGYLLGGWLIDGVFEPLMASLPAPHILPQLFGVGKGSGAALLFFVCAVSGVIICLVFRRIPHIWALEKEQ